MAGSREKMRARALHDLQASVRRLALELADSLADLQEHPKEQERAMAAVQFSVRAMEWSLACAREQAAQALASGQAEEGKTAPASWPVVP